MEKKKKKSKKNIILLIFIVIMLGLLAWAVVVLSGTADVDSRFVRDLDRAMTASWAQKNDEFALQSKKGTSVDFIELEYSTVSGYKDEKFKNKKLGKLAKTYISSLEACREAAASADPDKDFGKFWEAFSEPYGTRIKSLYDIYKGKYGFSLDDPGYAKKKDKFLAHGWLLKKVDSIEFSRTSNEDGTKALKAKVKNDSGFDLKHVNLEVELYDKRGNMRESVTVFAENIKRGEEFELLGYQMSGSKITGYRIVSETCEIDQ